MKKCVFTSSLKAAAPVGVLAGLIGANHALGQANNVFSPGTSAISPQTQSIETGPTLDVVPYVLADGYTINLALIPSDVEFSGYDSSALPPGLISGAVGNLNVVELPTVLPIFTVRQLVTTVNVWDNQTVVLGGLITSSVQETKNKVPVVGDLPLIGRLFQSQDKSTKRNNLMIFVTTTIVDPAGSRVHSDDELPFAGNAIPEQSPDNVKPTMTTKTIQAPGPVQGTGR